MLTHFAGIRQLLAKKVHADFGEIERAIAALEHDLEAALHHCHPHDGDRPAAVTITARTKEGIVSDTYTPGQTIYLTATVDNAEQVALTGVAGTWTADQGTVSANPNNPQEAQLVSVPVGVVNATFTTATGGVVGTYQATIADDTPASVTITGSTTPPSDEPAPAAPTA